MKYHLTADAIFEAKSFNHAVTKLADHLRELIDVGKDAPDGISNVDTPKFFDEEDFEITEVGHEGLLRK